MEKMILVYITCKGKDEAEKIGRHLMQKRLAPCFNIIPGMYSECFWPPKTGEIEKANETILLVKTLENKFSGIETEVQKIHSDTTLCIFAIPISQVSVKYYQWLKDEIKEGSILRTK
jgi:periplasmic divalent cation tolerance protein